MSNFRHDALRELTDQQVRFSPPQRRIDQLAHAERLLAEVDDGKSYPYQFVCYRITGYRPDTYSQLLISAEDLEYDLGLFISQLAASIPAIPVESVDEPVLTLQELSEKLNVTTKTINRWRKRGLIGLPVLKEGRRHVGFLPSLVEPFLENNQERIDRGRRFSQMSDDEKEDILKRARQMVRVDGYSLTEISRRIARDLGRSNEAIRYTIKNFDREYPEQALFPSAAPPLDTEAKQLIYNSYRRGITVKTLAKRFRRTPTSMYRIINETRALRLLEQPLDYIYHESFDDPSKEPEIMAPMPEAAAFEEARKKLSTPKDVPPELASLYETPLLSKSQEQHLFRKMNFLKHKVKCLREKLKLPNGRIDTAGVRTQDLDRIDELHRRSNTIKEMLINCNMRLVAHIAKKHVNANNNIFELISDGNVSLIRAVEKFDYSRGNKFSTYASWAIIKNFARSIPHELTRRERYVTGHEQVFDAAPDTRPDEKECLAVAEQATFKVNQLLDQLDPRERQIIRMRAGLDDDTDPMTLEKIGRELGITKERVRQINVRAMKKLRTLAERDKDDF